MNVAVSHSFPRDFLQLRSHRSAWRTVIRRSSAVDSWLDGLEGNVSLGASWAALPILRLDGNVGWNRSRANCEHWRSQGPQASLGTALALSAGFTVGLRASPQRTEYQGRSFAHRTIERQPCEDETLSLSIHNGAPTLAGFSHHLSLIREERDTNV